MDNSKLQGATGQPVGASLLLPKKWDEQTSDEKIETLRNELIMSRYTVRRLGELEGQVHLLKLHHHSAKGDVLIPIASAGAQGGAGLVSASMVDRLA